jgi:imidazolonepropionase-like amidohydrolase
MSSPKNSLFGSQLAAIACAALSFALCGTAMGQKKPAAKAAVPANNESNTPAKATVIRGGKCLTVSHGTVDNCAVVLDGGKITYVGAAGGAKSPAGANVIDATGMTVYPGLIDSETHLGLTEIEADPMTNDQVELSDEIMPHMHVYDAFHAESALIPVTRMNGITNAVVAPANRDTLPGQDIFIQLDGREQPDYILLRDNAMPLNFTGEQRRNESFEHSKFPSTRMGMAAQLRQTFIDTQEYMRKLDDWSKKSDADKAKGSEPKRDLKLEAIVPYLQGKKTVVLAAETGSDIDTAVALAQEFKLRFVLNHVTHSQKVLDRIAALKVPVIVGPIYEMPNDDERYDAVYSLPAQLAKRGVKVAFASYDAHQSRNLPYAAGYAVAFGLPHDEALRAITLTPAEIWGVADQLGSLDTGKTANVVVASGDPLDVKSDVKHVFIDGREIPLESRQTRLRDQYWKK